MDFGVVFSPLPGPSVSATRPFSDWMRAAETVCTTLVHAGFRYIVFTHSYQYGGMQPLITSACVHAAFSSTSCESALSSRASESTKRQ